MKMKLIAGLLLAGSCLFAAPRISIGVGIGLPAPAPVYYAPPPPVYVAPGYVPPPVYVAPRYVPPPPGPGYTWVTGYWYGAGPRRAWRPGYWAAPRGVYYRTYRHHHR
jgi:hypothetical protein